MIAFAVFGAINDSFQINLIESNSADCSWLFIARRRRHPLSNYRSDQRRFIDVKEPRTGVREGKIEENEEEIRKFEVLAEFERYSEKSLKFG